MNRLLNQKLVAIRARLDEVARKVHKLTTSIGQEQLEQQVDDLRSRINEPFLFVIVGEVKAGKSSFINALLAAGKDICKVGPQPVTDTIQQIVFGEKEEEININPYLKKIFQPVEILKEIAIVDTPGTNTIIEKHQEITEAFIPAADLIIFVFESKNPYRQSAWDFFNYIHADWRKKIIFVLQQKDLMPEADLMVNIKGVEEFAEKKGILQPEVFAVSAKQELEGDTENSGFESIKTFVNDHITGGKAPLLKLDNSASTLDTLREKIFSGLQTRKKQWDADTSFRQDIHETLDEHQERSIKQVKMLTDNILTAYDKTTAETERSLKDGLSFWGLIRRSFSSMFSKKESLTTWLENLTKNLERDLKETLSDRLQQGISDLASSVQQMARVIQLKLEKNENILKHNHEIFSDIADKRISLMEELRQAFSLFLSESDDFTVKELFPQQSSVVPNIAAGGGVAIVGVVLTFLTNTVIFDITGGIITTIGILFAGISSSSQRKKLVKGYQSEIERGRKQLKQQTEAKLSAYVKAIKSKIELNFTEFDLHLEKEEKEIKKLTETHTDIISNMKSLRTDLDKLLKRVK